MPKKDDIIIQEPPLEEFGKKHSCIKRTCLSGCGCLFLFLFGSIFLIHYATREHEREIKRIPPLVERNVPLYDTQNLSKIKIINGEERQKGFELAALIPKLFISPLIIEWPEKFVENPQKTGGNQAHIANIKKFLKKPLSESKDVVTVEWKNLSAEPKFVEEYYKDELTKRDFKIENTARTTSTSQLLFEKPGISGAVYIQDFSARKEGTDFVSVKVTMKVK